MLLDIGLDRGDGVLGEVAGLADNGRDDIRKYRGDNNHRDGENTDDDADRSETQPETQMQVGADERVDALE